ncbi:MAG: hypothetical protein GXX84_03380 [Acidobacteria bacterium]|nr:hypothetical protein [Acidobacteriota bacterium]
MRSSITPRRCAVLLVALFLLSAGMLPVVSRDDLGRTRSLAETQHEIVMLLIKQKEYRKAVSEADKIFSMDWPEDQEPLLLSELRLLSDQFLRQGQASFSLQLIERNAKYFRTPESRIAILKEKGYIHKCIGQDDKAMEYFREAMRLEKTD